MDPRLRPYNWTSASPMAVAPPAQLPATPTGRVTSAPVQYPAGNLLVRCAWVADAQPVPQAQPEPGQCSVISTFAV